MLNECSIIGIVGNYESNLKLSGKVKELNINNMDNALKMVGLEIDLLEQNINSLTIDELWKLELATKLENEIILIGNLSNSLNNKDIEYMKKLFIKLACNYNKKIVIVEKNVRIFFGLVKKVFIIENNKVIYQTSDFYDDKLYEYCKMPNIVEFIKFVNKDNDRLDETTDIYELIKDIYRRLS